MTADLNSEKNKWDDFYSKLSDIEETRGSVEFNTELCQLISNFLPDGGKILEAGSGGGWQSLYLSRTGKYQVTLMDFSPKALAYSQRLFEKENVQADFILGDVTTHGTPEYDLVFNAGVLEHYVFDQQIDMLKGMASRSRNFILTLLPNYSCYWYWIWRIQKSAQGHWPFGKEVPVDDLSDIFNKAGIHFLGQTNIGHNWSENFIQSLNGLDESLRDLILQVHRSGIISSSSTSYLLAALGTVSTHPHPALPDWQLDTRSTNNINHEVYSALADAIALNLLSQNKIQQLETLNLSLENQIRDSIEAAIPEAAPPAEINQSDVNVESFDRLLSQNQDLTARLEITEELLEQNTEYLEILQDEKLEYFQKYNDTLYQLFEVYRSRSWKLISYLRRLRILVLPTNSLFSRLLSRLAGSIVVLYKLFWRIVGNIYAKIIPKNIRGFYREFQTETPLIDRTDVMLFAPTDLLPNYDRRKSTSRIRSESNPVQVSLITTVLNEGSHCKEWFEALSKQSRLPDELIIVDGGSNDNTIETIKNYSEKSAFPIKLIEAPGANIATGRNIAIHNSHFPIIACTDFGCELENDWLHYIILPFEIDFKIQVSCGIYKALEADTIYDRFLISPIEAIAPANYLPSSRSLAFKKETWLMAGGYPEWLTDAGEDTFFDFLIKKITGRWALAPQAVVNWRGPKNLKKFLSTIERYSIGDGESGCFGQSYWKNYQSLIKTYSIMILYLLISSAFLASFIWVGLTLFTLLPLFILAWMLSDLSPRLRSQPLYKQIRDGVIIKLIRIAQNRGYQKGMKRRPHVRQKMVKYYQDKLENILSEHRDARDIIVYPPTHDWGFMFQRPHQVARSFARQGYLYFYCTNNEKTDGITGFYQVEPNLFVCHVPPNSFSLLKSPVLYIGSAWNRNAISNFNNPKILYDHYDDIVVSSANPHDHQALLNTADIVVVSSQRLLDAVISERPDAILCPNGVDYEYVRNIRESHPHIPVEMRLRIRSDRPVIGYSGALASWFDYDLLRKVALNLDEMEFVLIGVNYDRSLDASMILSLPNVHWLGMKPYEDLFKYILQFDIGIIPFKINEITLSTSPIKLFEYAACQKPVVTTPLPECTLYSEVLIASTAYEFTKSIYEAIRLTKDASYLAMLDDFAARNSWDVRIRHMIEQINEIKS